MNPAEASIFIEAFCLFVIGSYNPKARNGKFKQKALFQKLRTYTNIPEPILSHMENNILKLNEVKSYEDE